MFYIYILRNNSFSYVFTVAFVLCNPGYSNLNKLKSIFAPSYCKNCIVELSVLKYKKMNNVYICTEVLQSCSIYEIKFD